MLRVAIVYLFLSLTPWKPCAAELPAGLPSVQVSNIRRVFHNGEHNAFTDLVKFRDTYYLTFRSCPDGHMVHPSASIIILASEDTKTWRPVHRFSVPKRDTRDPHFLVFQEKLFVYTGTWYCGESSPARSEYTLNRHLGYAVWSGDGNKWSNPTMLEGTFGHYIWKANTYDGKAYLCGRRNRDFEISARGEGAIVQSAMLESDDGLTWRTRTLFQEERGDETVFQFESNGAIVAIGRRGSSNAQLLRSNPPWTTWARSDLDRYIGGPMLAKWGSRYVAGGRRSIPGVGPRTSMCWFAEDRLHEFAQLPSGGDNSYPGFIAFSSKKALMSWYSSHEKDASGKTITAIYLADLTIPE
ncbi:MAG: hypothetical protein ACI9OD_004495 [Limisphaerales bacterium]|jgi:hypothetical protein